MAQDQTARMMSGIVEMDETFVSISYMVGLEDKKAEKLKGFSSGQRQRVGIAQALLEIPKFWCWTSRRRGLTRKNGSGSAVSSVIFPSKKLVLLSTHIVSDHLEESQTKSFCSGKVLSSNAKPASLLEQLNGQVCSLQFLLCDERHSQSNIHLQQCHAHRRKSVIRLLSEPLDPTQYQQHPIWRICIYIISADDRPDDSGWISGAVKCKLLEGSLQVFRPASCFFL